MSAGRPGKPKSMEMTWSEKELAQHVQKKYRDKKKTSGTSTADGSSKSSPRVGTKQGATSGTQKSGLSSTMPAKRGSVEVKKGGKERLSLTAAAAGSGGSSRRGSAAGSRVRNEGEVKRRSFKDLSSQVRSKGSRESGERRGERRRDEDQRRGTRSERGGRDSGRGREESNKRERERGRGREEGQRGREGEKSAVTSTSSTEKQKTKSPQIDRKPPPAGRIPQPMEEVKDGDAIEEDFEYDNDFEEDDYDMYDFDEDIEEDTESEENSDDVIGKSPPATNPDPSSTDRIDLVEIMQAIDAENEDAAARPLQLEPTPTSEVKNSSSQESQRSLSQRKFVDFSSAKKSEEKERVARVTKKRGQELLSLIELDVATFDLFELRPLSEYEVYMRSFGSVGSRQVGCQTGEDTTEEGTQTEEIEVREKWVQWPPEDLKGYGGPDEEGEEATVGETTGSAVRLASFLKRASQVVSVLLEENVAQSSTSQTGSNQSQIPFCSTRMKIEPPSGLSGCTLTSVEFSHAHPHLIMTIHSPAAVQEKGVGPVPRGGGAICVWSTREPSQPQFLLVSQSPSLCGCFGPLKRTPLVFSGTADGSLLLWDLRESTAIHTHPPGVATPTCHAHIPRQPTFSTAALPQKSGHTSPIVSLSPITTSSTPHSSHPLTSNDADSATIGLSFQLASLDKSGLLIIWVAVETKPHPQGSESDLGLIPNGRVKLVWSAALDTMRSSPDSIPAQTLCVRFHSTDTNHLFLGTDEGRVVHRTRYSGRPIPKQYQCQTHNPCPCDVTSLSLSPWQPDYFLASYSNGNISLYNIKKANPLVVWSESTNGIAVSKVEWAWHIPGMFLVLDSQSTLYLWNLTENDREPAHTYRCGEDAPSILSFSLSSSSPSIALCLSNSTLVIHQLSPTAADTDTLQQQTLPNFTNYLHSL